MRSAFFDAFHNRPGQSCPIQPRPGFIFIPMAAGWVKIHRKIMESNGYFSEPFCRNMAWVDLIILANHDDNFFRARGIRIDVKRGQVGYGLEELSKRWKWSRGKAERFLRELENTNTVVRQKSNITTLITIVNYDEYQSGDKANSKADDKASSKANGQQTVKQTDTNKNDKKVKNEKNEEKNTGASAQTIFISDDFKRFLEFIETNAPTVGKMTEPFTEKQFFDLKTLHPAQKIAEILQDMHNYKPLLRKNKSAFLTAKKWLKPKENGTQTNHSLFSNGHEKLGTSSARTAAVGTWGS